MFDFKDQVVIVTGSGSKRGGGVFGGVHYSASKEAGYITGEDIDINGGSHMD